MVKPKVRELAKQIYISALTQKRPTAYYIWKIVVSKGHKVSRTTIWRMWKDNQDKWEGERLKNIEDYNIKLNAEVVKQKVTETVQDIKSLSDIKENLLKEFEHIDGKSKEGVTRALIELEKALKDKTTSFTPPTSIIIKSKEYEEKIAQLSKKGEENVGVDNKGYVNLDGSTRVNETSKGEKDPKTANSELSTGKEPKSDEKQLPNEQEGGDGGNRPTNNNE